MKNLVAGIVVTIIIPIILIAYALDLSPVKAVCLIIAYVLLKGWNK